MTLRTTRRLDEHELMYAWADGIYVRAGLGQEKAAHRSRASDRRRYDEL